MKIDRHDTYLKIEKSDEIELVTDWTGAPFKIQKVLVKVYEDRAVIEVKGRAAGFTKGMGTATFKIGGDAKYRDCPQWLQDMLVKAGVMLWEVKVG